MTKSKKLTIRMKATLLCNNILSLVAYPCLVAAPRIRASRVSSLGYFSTITSNPPPCSFSSLAKSATMPGVDPPQMEWSAKKVRDTFIKFFEGKNHVNWKSSPVVPHNDPTLLFANAGTLYFSIFNLVAVITLNGRMGRS